MRNAEPRDHPRNPLRPAGTSGTDHLGAAHRRNREAITARNSSTGARNVISQTQADRTASMERFAAKLGQLAPHVATLEPLNAERKSRIECIA